VSCVAQLSCPVCGASLEKEDGNARCRQGHAFDYARSGYLNLTATGGRRQRLGDTPAMITARAEFLAAGHFQPIADAVGAAVVAGHTAGALAEIGSGSGYYLGVARERLRESGPGPSCTFGFDLSKSAAAHAARRHGDVEFVVADVEAGIPLLGSTVGVAISVFSPRPAAELGRVVRSGGELVVALAGPRHLERLRGRLRLMGVHGDKLAGLEERLARWFTPVATEAVEYEIELGVEDTRRLIEMGPNAWHDVDLSELDGELSEVVSVLVARYRRT
jgi:23S rRNA (guanine745-N1)-methyltransferase